MFRPGWSPTGRAAELGAEIHASGDLAPRGGLIEIDLSKSSVAPGRQVRCRGVSMRTAVPAHSTPAQAKRYRTPPNVTGPTRRPTGARPLMPNERQAHPAKPDGHDACKRDTQPCGERLCGQPEANGQVRGQDPIRYRLKKPCEDGGSRSVAARGGRWRNRAIPLPSHRRRNQPSAQEPKL